MQTSLKACFTEKRKLNEDIEDIALLVDGRLFSQWLSFA